MSVRDVILRHGVFAHGGDPDGATDAWEQAGFAGEEAEEWLLARCFTASAARDLADAGVTPLSARMRTSAGSGDYVDTVGFKVADGDLGPEEARDLLGEQ